MATKISFSLGNKAGTPDVNQKKRKGDDIETDCSAKKPKLSFVQDDNKPQTAPQPTLVKRYPLTCEVLRKLDLLNMADKKQAGVSAWQKSALNAGATSDHLRKDKIIKSSSAGATEASPRSRQSSRHSSISSRSTQSGSTRARGTRVTDSFIMFWGGPLSNWSQGTRFSGWRAVDLLLPRLDALNLGDGYPSRKRFATQLLCTHTFGCGEQWMMACKAWLFETTVYDLAKSEWESLPPGEYENIRHRLMITALPSDIQEKALHQSSLCRILRASQPKDQKEIARTTRNWSEEVWSKANMAIVVAGSIARAEKDRDLAAMYEGNQGGKREFVESSPFDRIWGVGLGCDDRRIDSRSNWKGENRLGRCHDEACRVFNQKKNKEAKIPAQESEKQNWESQMPVPEAENQSWDAEKTAQKEPEKQSSDGEGSATVVKR